VTPCPQARFANKTPAVKKPSPVCCYDGLVRLTPGGEPLIQRPNDEHG